MTKKNMILAAVAVAAVLIAMGSSVARCSMQQPLSERDEDEPRAESPAEGLCMAALVGTEWTLEDGSGEMAIVQGAFVEGAGADAEVTYFTVGEESERDGVLTASISATRDVTSGHVVSIVRVEPTDEGMRLSCDELSGTYLSKAPDSTVVRIENAAPELEESMGVGTERMEGALSAFAAERSPHATSAAWEGEVWIDFAYDRASTTFVLDDAARTVVTVLVEDGAVEVI